MGRLMAIGVDSADLDYIRSRRSCLPTLSRLLETGVLHEFEGMMDLAGGVWQTLATGQEPGEHGWYQHLVWDAQRMSLRPMAPGWRDVPAFWRGLEAAGYRVVAVDMPYTYPNNLRDGIELVDWGTHGQTLPFSANRPGLTRVLRRRYGHSPIGREVPMPKSLRRLAAIARQLRRAVVAKTDLLIGLLREQPWDVFLATFGEIHRAGHSLFSPEDDASRPPARTHLLSVYQTLDEQLARLLGEIDTSTTAFMLFSPEGMAANPAQGHVIRPVMAALNHRFLVDEGLVGDGPVQRPGFVTRLRSSVPSSWQHRVADAAPDWFRRWVVNREVTGGLDWSRTPGFALRTDIRFEVRLNLQGRERQGMLVPGSDQERRYRDRLCEVFATLQDAATGERLIETVVDIHARYPGPRSDALPDYAVLWRPVPHAARVYSPALDETFTFTAEPPRGGDHTDQAFVLLQGNAADVDGPRRVSDMAYFVTAVAGRAVGG